MQFRLNEFNRKKEYIIVEIREREIMSKTISNQYLKHEKIMKSVMETLQKL